VSFGGEGARCGYPSNPQELVVEALLPLARLRATDLPGDDEVFGNAYYAKLARPIRSFLDRLYHAAGFASPLARAPRRTVLSRRAPPPTRPPPRGTLFAPIPVPSFAMLGAMWEPPFRHPLPKQERRLLAPNASSGGRP